MLLLFTKEQRVTWVLGFDSGSDRRMSGLCLSFCDGMIPGVLEPSVLLCFPESFQRSRGFQKMKTWKPLVGEV